MEIAGIKFGRGDIDGLLGIFVDNLSVFLVIISLNLYVVGMPAEIVFGRILPGAAIGLLVGNIYYAYMAKRLAQKEGRQDVTALPFGISIVFVIAYTMGILFPITKLTGDPVYAWKVSMVATIIGGILEILGAVIAVELRRFLPRAAMLGALAGIGIMFIAGGGIDDVFSNPYVGFPALAIILWAYLARGKMPWSLPGGLVALIVGTIIALAMGQTRIDASGVGFYAPIPWAFQITGQAFVESLKYLGIIIPVAVINFVVTLDNVESAAAAGDNYSVRETLVIDGIGSIVGALFGCSYPNTVFIGHPGYKRMGALMGYSLLNTILIIILAFFGLLSLISQAVPLAAVTPILIFVGLVMTEVAFKEVTADHMVASAAAIIPVVAELAKEQIDMALNALGIQVTPDIINKLQAAGVNYLGYFPLSQGTILISMFLGAIVAFMVSRELLKAGYISLVAALFSWLGIIHAPALKWGADPKLALAWLILAVILFGSHAAGAGQKGNVFS
ncbi:MAG: xanthine/uracil/vitamin C permease [Thermoanaerobacteraceae bacterium]|nr:xanthine/uracil/vitamin C permease [Thermoanaerobacteraceae bacterium]